MPTNNAIDLTSQGLAYYNGTGTFTAPTLTNHGVVVGTTSNNAKTLALMTNGDILIGSTGADPVPAALGIGAGLSASGGPGSLTLRVSGGGLIWQNATTSITLTVSNGYFVTSGALNLALPAAASQGDQIIVALNGGTSWTITQAAGQSIRFGNTVTTTGITGSLASSAQGDTVRLVCSTTNTGWFLISSVGTLTVT